MSYCEFCYGTKNRMCDFCNGGGVLNELACFQCDGIGSIKCRKCEDPLTSGGFGKFIAGKIASESGEEIDGSLEIDEIVPPEGSSREKYITQYEVRDNEDRVVASGAINYYDKPYSVVLYIVYEIARRKGVFRPSNLIMENGQWITAGISQPSFEDPLLKEYWFQVEKFFENY